MCFKTEYNQNILIVNICIEHKGSMLIVNMAYAMSEDAKLIVRMKYRWKRQRSYSGVRLATTRFLWQTSAEEKIPDTLKKKLIS